MGQPAVSAGSISGAKSRNGRERITFIFLFFPSFCINAIKSSARRKLVSRLSRGGDVREREVTVPVDRLAPSPSAQIITVERCLTEGTLSIF